MLINLESKAGSPCSGVAIDRAKKQPMQAASHRRSQAAIHLGTWAAGAQGCAFRFEIDVLLPLHRMVAGIYLQPARYRDRRFSPNLGEQTSACTHSER